MHYGLLIFLFRLPLVPCRARQNKKNASATIYSAYLGALSKPVPAERYTRVSSSSRWWNALGFGMFCCCARASNKWKDNALKFPFPNALPSGRFLEGYFKCKKRKCSDQHHQRHTSKAHGSGCVEVYLIFRMSVLSPFLLPPPSGTLGFH